MKCLTVHQPLAWAIFKRGALAICSSFPTAYRGELLIRSGESLERLFGESNLRGLRGDIRAELVFGAILGVCRVENVVRSGLAEQAYPELADWIDASAGWVWKLDRVRAFAAPVKCDGGAGLFDVPSELVAEQLGRRRELAPADESPAAEPVRVGLFG